MHHSIDTFSAFQWTATLSNGKALSIILHLKEAFNTMDTPPKIQIINVQVHV